jgi:hypothetical protein
MTVHVKNAQHSKLEHIWKQFTFFTIWSGFTLSNFFSIYLSSIVNYGAFGSSLAFNLVRFMILFNNFFLSIASHAKKALYAEKNV